MRKLRIGVPLLALALCLMGWTQAPTSTQAHNTALGMLSYTVTSAGAETPIQPEEERIELDGAVYQFENGIAYVMDYVIGADVVHIPLSVRGLPISFERFWNRPSKLPKLILAEGYTQVTSWQFSGACALELVLPSTLREIGNYAFSSIYGLKSLTIPEGVERIGESAFAYATLESVSLPSTAQSIAHNTFYSCINLRSISVHPDNTNYTSIDGVLYSKDGKTLLSFPEGYGKSYTTATGTEAIDAQAFGYNQTLQTLTISEGVRTLTGSSFTGCVALSKVHLSTTLETIEDNALPLSQLDALEIPPGNPHFQSVNGSVYSTASKVLIFHPRGTDTAFSVLPGTKRIGPDVFWGDDVIQSVSLPLGLEAIDSRAFIDCTALESISLPLTLTEIGDYAFANCIALNRLTLPPCLISIGSGAFSNCPSLTELSLPSSLQVIDEFAFEYTPQVTITAKSGTIGEAYARARVQAIDPLGLSHLLNATGAAGIPISVGIVNNFDTDDLLPLYETTDSGSILGWYPNGTTMIIRGDLGEWVSVIAGHVEGYVKADGLMRNEAFYSLYRPVVADVPIGPVDLMSAPLAEASILERMEGGTKLNVTAACGTWYQVLWDEEVAYVPTNLVSIVQYEDLGEGGQYGVVENPSARDRLHLRDKASREGKSLKRFFNGTQVEIMSQQGDWYHVRVAGIEGYMMASYVKRVTNAI